MKTSRFILGILGSTLLASQTIGQVIIQFGGEAGKITRLESGVDVTTDDTNWQSQIGADQIIQWNGVSAGFGLTGGSFNSAGSLANKIVTDNAKLNSIGSENLVLSTIDIESDVAGTERTNATLTPNVFGIDVGTGTNAQFNTDNAEVWTFSFDQTVTLLNIVGSGMDFDLERWGLDIGNDDTYEYQWNRLDGFTAGAGTVAETTYNTPNRYVATFGTGIEIAAGTEIAITALQGNMNLQSIVVSAVPEPGTYGLILGALAMGWIMIRRRQK
jgi:hypothetical protein